MREIDQRASLLRQLHALNKNFVEHLLDDSSAFSGQINFIAQLRALDAHALHELCASPYALYYLPFGSGDYWRDSAALNEQMSDLPAAAPVEHGARRITQQILFLAWHVACTHVAVARQFFGMSTCTLEFFRHTDVATLSDLSAHAARVLQPRWPANPYFWPALIRCAGTDAVRMQAVRLLGAQLLAGELHGGHSFRRLPRRTRALAKQPRKGQNETVATPALAVAPRLPA